MEANSVQSTPQNHVNGEYSYATQNGYASSGVEASPSSLGYSEQYPNAGYSQNCTGMSPRLSTLDYMSMIQEMFGRMLQEMHMMFQQMMAFFMDQMNYRSTTESPQTQTAPSEVGASGTSPGESPSTMPETPIESPQSSEGGSSEGVPTNSPTTSPEDTSSTEVPGASSEPVEATTGGGATAGTKNEADTFLAELEAGIDKAGKIFDGILALKDKILGMGKKKKKAYKVLKEIFGPLLKKGSEFTKDTLGPIWKKLKKLLSSLS